MRKLKRMKKTHKDDFLVTLGLLYEKEMNQRSNDDFVVNPPQMEKFTKVLDFFIEMTDTCNGTITSLDFEPKKENAGITAEFSLVDIYANNTARFAQIIAYTSAITMDCTRSGVCISVMVPDVFIPKSERKDN